MPAIVRTLRTLRTLRDVYQDLRRERADRRPATLAEYRTSLDRWDAFLRHDPRMANPGVSLGRADLVDFREWLLAQRHPITGEPLMGTRTANKYVNTILALVRHAAEDDPDLRVPRVRPLATRRAAEKLYCTDHDLDALYQAAERAVWPVVRGVPADLWWQAALVLWLAKGFRTQELVRYDSDVRALDWSAVRWEPDHPHHWGRTASPHGWIVYTPQKQERCKPEPLVLPLTEIEALHLRSIAPPDRSGPLFPWPLNKRSFYGQWQRLIEDAGLDPALLPKHLRKTCVTRVETVAPGMAPFLTGHAPRTVQAAHYHNPDAGLRAAVDAFPFPPAIVAGARRLAAHASGTRSLFGD